MNLEFVVTVAVSASMTAFFLLWVAYSCRQAQKRIRENSAEALRELDIDEEPR